MRKFIASLLVMSFVGCSASVLAKEENPFITSREIDLIKLLPPPPANDSLQTKEELREILALQASRTPEMVARSQADATENIWRFADVMGVRFKREQLPAFAKFFERVEASEGAVVDTYKDVWKRPRPYLYSSEVKPVVKMSHSGSYPSGHATGGTLMGIVLANMVPEKRAEIMARAAEYANNRVIGGVHYRSDIEAGRIAGTVIAARLQARDDFNMSFEAARKELRNVLELSPEPVGSK